jgi:hypothetical protein
MKEQLVRRKTTMRAFAMPLAILVALGGCKTEKPPLEARFTRAVMVDPQPVHDDRQVIGEVKPRYESELSFRVTGKKERISVRMDVPTRTRSTRVQAVAAFEAMSWSRPRDRTASSSLGKHGKKLYNSMGSSQKFGNCNSLKLFIFGAPYGSQRSQ